jgi:hypothetical protein
MLFLFLIVAISWLDLLSLFKSCHEIFVRFKPNVYQFSVLGVLSELLAEGLAVRVVEIAPKVGCFNFNLSLVKGRHLMVAGQQLDSLLDLSLVN